MLGMKEITRNKILNYVAENKEKNDSSQKITKTIFCIEERWGFYYLSKNSVENAIIPLTD